MNLPVSGCKLFATMTAAMVFGLTAQAQRAGSTGDKIEFSEPSNPAAVSNLNSFGSSQSMSKRLEEDLSRPLSIDGQSMSRSIARPGPSSLNPVIQNQRSKELLDRKKNWIFREMNELSSDNPLDEKFGLWQTGEAKQKKAMSPMERYFETSDRKSDKSASPWSESARAGKNEDFTSPNVLNSSGTKLTPTEQMFRGFNGPDLSDNPFVPPGASGGLVDGLSNFGSPLHSLRSPEQQKRMDEFQEILTGHSMTTPASSLNADAFRPNLGGGSADYRSALNPAMLGDINSGLNFHSHAFEDSGARIFGSPPPAKTVEKPKSWVEPQLQALPQRKF